MKAHLLLKRPLDDPRSPINAELARELVRRGWQVVWTCIQIGVVDFDSVVVDSDVYLVRTSSLFVLSLVGILHDRGAMLLNSLLATSLVRDKPRATAAMNAIGLPVPRTCIAPNALTAFSSLGNKPIILKPPRGSGGDGIEISYDESQAEKIDGGPCFAQVYERISQDDLKIYVIGEDVFVVRRSIQASTLAEKWGQICECPAEIRRVALVVGKLFGLEIYGIDIVETSRGPVIVDVNAAPGLIGVPNAAGLLADYMERRA